MARRRQSASTDHSITRRDSAPHRRASTGTVAASTQSSGDANFHNIRGIIAENFSHYKVDWEDHPSTGEQYEPTWVPKRDVTTAAKEVWERRQAAETAVETAPQVPRPRGRPRKISTGRPGRPPKRKFEELASAPEPAVSIEDTTSDNQQRRRGRPRKSILVESSPVAASPDLPDTVNTPQPPKPRGRPRKSRPVKSSPVAGPSVTPGAVGISQPERPRGRPRKSIPPASSPIAEQSVLPETVNTPAPKRPRGRPRKSRPLESSAVPGQSALPGTVSTPPPKRPRGRPRKSIATESSPVLESSLLEDDDQEEEHLQPRERPRKRRVTESSPEPEGSSPRDIVNSGQPNDEFDNESHDEFYDCDDDRGPEIQDSQQSTGGAEQDAVTSLFVNRATSETSQRPSKRLKTSAVVEVSDPPSSFYAGVYQRLASPSANSIPESPQVSPLTKDLASTAAEALDEPNDTDLPSQAQAGHIRSASQVVPDSQDQEEIFCGFSPDSRLRPSQYPQLTQPAPLYRPVDSAASGNPQRQETTSTQIESELNSQATQIKDASNKSATSENQPDETGEEPSNLTSESVAQADPTRVEGAKESEPQTQRSDSLDPSQEHVLSQTKELSQEQANSAQEQFQSEADHGNASQQAREASQAVSASQQSFVTRREQQVLTIESSTSSKRLSQLLTQSDYQPPPAGQRPPPSSNLEEHPEVPSYIAQLGLVSSAPITQASQAEASSSFPFQTQVGNLHYQTEAIETIEADTTIQHSSRARSTTPSSSPIGSVPSQSLPTIGDSAPAAFESQFGYLPHTPERLEMNPSSVPTPSHLTASLKAMRDERAARRSQPPATQPASSLPPNISAEVAAARASPIPSYLQEGARSPSTVPAMERSPVITKEEMNTSERFDTLLPQAQANGSGLQGRSHGASLTTADTPKAPPEPNQDPEIANAHIVPVPLVNHQGDQYRQNIYNHRQTINDFLQERDPAQELLADAEQVIERLRSIAMHPDLVNLETLTQMSEPEMQKQWDVDCSGKFRFLDELLSQLRELNLHIALVAKGDRVPDMLETFLRGSHVPFSRGSTSQVEAPAEQTGPRVTVINLDHTADDEVGSADLVIALDGRIDPRHPIIRKARRHETTETMSQTNSWAMLVTLVAPQTIEHIERCMATNLSPTVRARVLLSSTLKMSRDAGRAEDGQLSPKEAAMTLADFIDDHDADEWPLAPLGQIEDLDSQTETEIEQSSNDVASSAHTGEKRSFDMLGAASPEELKRPRLDDASQMPATINPQDIEVTHVSDSLGRGTQTITDMTDAFHPMAGPSGMEIQQQQVIDDLENRLGEHVQALSDVQYRYEEQRKDLVARKKENDDLTKRLGVAIERMTLTENANTALKVERTALKLQLEEANRRLLDHSIPERQEFETLRLATEQANLDKVKAEKRAEATNKDLEFARSLYQDSSNRARDLADQNKDLETQLSQSQKLAAGEQAKVKALSQDIRNKALQRENAQLKQILENRDAALKFKDEEITRLREAGRGRMGTRQSSVPRSPRLGSPMRMGAGGGRGSRQASPSAGELGRGRGGGHPLRNSG